MKLSTLAETYAEKETNTEFYGYNHSLKIGEGEFYDMQNMTGDYYPLIGTRDKRDFTEYDGDIVSMCVIDGKLCVATRDTLYVNNKQVYRSSVELEGDQERTIIGFGSYVIMLPDKMYYNLRDADDNGLIDSTYFGDAEFTLCDSEGNDFSDMTVSNTEPSNPNDGDYWIDTSGDNYTLKQWVKTESMWISIGTQYIRICATGIADSFEERDGVYITFSGDTEIYRSGSWGVANTTKTKNRVSKFKQQFKKAAFVVQRVHKDTDRSKDFIVVIGNIMYSTRSHITVKRQMPNLDYVIECGNRLWGCRYGKAINGEFVNEIYASALGDFKNWSVYAGTSQDSYTASCGTGGPWTGAVAYKNSPHFFKENYLHKVYGSYPSAYQIISNECRGVMKKASKSLAVLNDAVYYKSPTGICVYDGSTPADISSNFGRVEYNAGEAVAGVIGNKYYISMKSEVDKKWHLFAYDANNHIWYREDNTHIKSFVYYNSDLYGALEDNSRLMIIRSNGGKNEADFDWFLETGLYGINIPDTKYISRLLVRMSLAIGASARFYIEYDSNGEWTHVGTIVSKSLNSFSLPLRPRRCDHFKLRIEGHGDVKFYSITKSVENGGETV